MPENTGNSESKEPLDLLCWVREHISSFSPDTSLLAIFADLQEKSLDLLGQPCLFRGEQTTISWWVIADILKEIYKANYNEEHFRELDEKCRPPNLFVRYVSLTNAEEYRVSDGLNYIFSNSQHAQYFKNFVNFILEKIYLNYEMDLVKICEENNKYLIKLSWSQVKFINSFTTSETNALRYLDHSYLAKTISGFGNSSAWRHALTATTLRNKEEKPPFRNRSRRGSNRIRVHLRSNGELGFHDNLAKGKGSSLHQAEKTRRESGREIPLPPHQSFTYYTVNKDYRVSFFVPKSLSDIAKNELIGVRVKVEGTPINRIYTHDPSTYEVCYGFETEDAATQYIQQECQADKWPTSYQQLNKNEDDFRRKAVSTGVGYNEVMARAQWNCDGSSMILIYSSPNQRNPHLSTAKLKAILYRMDLERFLSSEPIYQNPPVNWYRGYQVPIAVWNYGKHKLFTRVQQEQFLDNINLISEETLREYDLRYKFLMLAIDFLQGKDITATPVYRLVVEQLSRYSKTVDLLEYISLLEGLTTDFTPLYSQIFERCKISDFISLCKSSDILSHPSMMIALLKQFAKRDPANLKDILENINLTIFCKQGNLKAIEEILNLANSFNDQERVDIIKSILLKNNCAVFITACEYGYHQIVEKIIDTVESLTNH